jgi:putative endonuclease
MRLETTGAPRPDLVGVMAHLGGLAAEDAVARHYLAQGLVIAERRWRGRGGEIDLILREPDGGLVFVEVKKSRTLARAAESLSRRQCGRLYAAASEYLGGEPAGQDSAARFDVALMDETGTIEVIENALWM